MAEGLKPPKWRLAWPPVLAVLVWSVILILGTAWLSYKPNPELAPRPIHVFGHEAMWTETGRWRVETFVTVESECRIEVRRSFVPPSADGPIQPAASYLDPFSPGNLPYLVTAAVREDAVVWYEYKLPPEMIGAEYLIEVIAWQCDNGYTGPVGRWIVPVAPPARWTE